MATTALLKCSKHSKQDALGDNRLLYRCRHLANWTKQSVVFESGLFCPLYENMTSSMPSEGDRATATGQHVQKIW